MGMYLFALIMIVLNLAAFGPGVLDLAPRLKSTLNRVSLILFARGRT
jgi:hypothetical protein